MPVSGTDGASAAGCRRILTCPGSGPPSPARASGAPSPTIPGPRGTSHCHPDHATVRPRSSRNPSPGSMRSDAPGMANAPVDIGRLATIPRLATEYTSVRVPRVRVDRPQHHDVRVEAHRAVVSHGRDARGRPPAARPPCAGRPHAARRPAPPRTGRRGRRHGRPRRARPPAPRTPAPPCAGL